MGQKLSERLDRKKEKDIRVLSDFVAVFCREKHDGASKKPVSLKDVRLERCLGSRELRLCGDCAKLLQHGVAKLLICPYDPKPMCKKCRTHCYAPGYRERVREVMRFSGLYLVKHGRLDMVFHYLF